MWRPFFAHTCTPLDPVKFILNNVKSIKKAVELQRLGRIPPTPTKFEDSEQEIKTETH